MISLCVSIIILILVIITLIMFLSNGNCQSALKNLFAGRTNMNFVPPMRMPPMMM